MPGTASRHSMARRVTIFGMRKCAGCGQRLPRPLPPRVRNHQSPAPPRTPGPRRRLTARPHPHAGTSPRTPRPLQPPVTPRHIEAEVIHCVGGVVSPLLANVYLHYVFDLWADWWRKKHARGDVIIVRFADDFVVGFQHREDAELFLAGL